jgi:hypothetical protein
MNSKTGNFAKNHAENRAMASRTERFVDSLRDCYQHIELGREPVLHFKIPCRGRLSPEASYDTAHLARVSRGFGVMNGTAFRSFTPAPPSRRKKKPTIHVHTNGPAYPILSFLDSLSSLVIGRSDSPHVFVCSFHIFPRNTNAEYKCF